MTSQHFKNSARTLAQVLDNSGITYDVYSLLNLTDALMGVSFVDPTAPPTYDTHDSRVLAALASPAVVAYMQEGKKINAIKELRAITLCGLKEAKDAVEDQRVMVYYINRW